MACDHQACAAWTAVAALAAPHLLYAFIWFFPQQWMAAFKKTSVKAFETVAWALKALQFSSVAYWYIVNKPSGVDLAAVPLAAWAAAVALGAGGQALNAGIFAAIGHVGVYYGYKLGHSIPWVEGFPFNVISHPQYVGSVLTVWAAAALVWTQAPAGVGLLAAYWTALYVVTGWMESSLHT